MTMHLHLDNFIAALTEVVLFHMLPGNLDSHHFIIYLIEHLA